MSKVLCERREMPVHKSPSKLLKTDDGHTHMQCGRKKGLINGDIDPSATAEAGNTIRHMHTHT